MYTMQVYMYFVDWTYGDIWQGTMSLTTTIDTSLDLQCIRVNIYSADLNTCGHCSQRDILLRKVVTRQACHDKA
jgi:hypothetical protein